CKHLLNKFGGHPMAAGISLDYEKVEELRRELNQNTTLTQEDLCPKISFDMVLPFEKINLSLIEEMEELKPYGRGNEKPLFALKNVEILGAKILGKNKNVLKLQVKTDSFKGNYTAMIFQNHLAFLERVQEKYGKEAVEDLLENRKSIRMDLIFQLNVNEYNGMESVQLMVQNFR
ncbi:MAG: single-stranded-DNA-specific exonuclease RecJ, partial [Acetivibrio sp.]